MRAFGPILALAAMLAGGLAQAAEAPTLRIAVLKFGTVNWLLDTVLANGFDAREGYRLDAVGLAGKPATVIAFQSGDADMMVNDWMWALARRGKGADLRFSPYSVALGALMTRGDVGGLCELRGRRLGVVGGKADKSWLVFQALARKRCGFELAEENEVLFGAPPLMARQLESGEVDAVSTFWHWAARMEAGGKTRLVGVAEAMAELGIAPAPALIGFVWNADRTDAATAAAFLRSVEAARALLASDDAAWEPLRGRMKAGDDKTFAILRDRFREGVPGAWSDAETEVSARLHRFLVERAPASFAKQAGVFDPLLFAAAR